jgi:hypothetical protein
LQTFLQLFEWVAFACALSSGSSSGRDGRLDRLGWTLGNVLISGLLITATTTTSRSRSLTLLERLQQGRVERVLGRVELHRPELRIERVLGHAPRYESGRVVVINAIHLVSQLLSGIDRDDTKGQADRTSLTELPEMFERHPLVALQDLKGCP